MAVLTQSQQESPTDDGRRRSVRSAGKVGPPGDSIRAAAAPAAAGGVRGHAGVDACASVSMGAGEDARRRGRRARTATDAVASSARWGCSHPAPGSASSIWSAGSGTRSSPGSQSVVTRAPD